MPVAKKSKKAGSEVVEKAPALEEESAKKVDAFPSEMLDRLTLFATVVNAKFISSCCHMVTVSKSVSSNLLTFMRRPRIKVQEKGINGHAAAWVA